MPSVGGERRRERADEEAGRQRAARADDHHRPDVRALVARAEQVVPRRRLARGEELKFVADAGSAISGAITASRRSCRR